MTFQLLIRILSPKREKKISLYWYNSEWTNLVNYKLLTIFSQLESEELAPKTRIKHTSDLTYNCSNWYEPENSAE